MIRIGLCILLLPWAAVPSPAQRPDPAPPPRRGFERAGAPGVTHAPPKSWREQQAGAARLAQWEFGKEDPATCTVLWFGKNGAGTVEANLIRWSEQIDGKEGTRSTPKPGKGLKATMIEKSGTYVAEITPGSRQRHEKPGYRLIGCILETPDGPLYIRIVGPEATVAAERRTILAWIEGFETGKPPDPPPLPGGPPKRDPR